MEQSLYIKEVPQRLVEDIKSGKFKSYLELIDHIDVEYPNFDYSTDKWDDTIRELADKGNSFAQSYYALLQINAGNYNKKIVIYKKEIVKNSNGFPINQEVEVLSTYAKVKTTRGFTLIANNSDFEKAFTNFTIRYPKTEITRDMFIKFNNKIYTIEYLNNIDEANIELEIQAKVVVK